LLLQCAALVIKHQQIDGITALFHVLNVSNVLLHSVDAFDELADIIRQYVCNMSLCYLYILNHREFS